MFPRQPEHVAVLAADDAELTEAPVLRSLAVAVLAHAGADVAPLLGTRVTIAAEKVVLNTNPEYKTFRSHLNLAK